MFALGFIKAASPIIQPPKINAPKPMPLGAPQIPKPVSPRPVVKDEYGKLRGPQTPLRPPSSPQAAVGQSATKTAAGKKVQGQFANIFARLHENEVPKSDWAKENGSKTRTEPLGATMPNQGTGGGIAGSYGSN